MMKRYEKARKMVSDISKLINPHIYPQASRILWKIPLKYFLDDVTPETYAGLIIHDAEFWSWFLKQENATLRKDIGLAFTIYYNNEEEIDKVLTDDDLKNNFYYKHYHFRR